jgi:hypothetical protein
MRVNAGIMHERPFEYGHRRGKEDAVLSIEEALSIEDSTGSLYGQSAREQCEVFLDNLGVIVWSAKAIRVDAI